MSKLSPEHLRSLIQPDRVHRDVYTDPALFELEMQQLFGKAWLVLGEVVGVHIDTHLLEDGIYQTAKARPVTRGGGPADYFVVTPESRFLMPRPANWDTLHRPPKD